MRMIADSMMSTTTKRFWIPAMLGIAFGFVGFGVVWMTPSLERWVYDWRITHRSAVVQDSRILLVPIENRDPILCGPTRWDRLALTRVISALGQAHAAVIAPVAALEDIPAPECGDVIGEAGLIEATTLAGNVVYPDTVAESLQDAARAIGALRVAPDDDGVVRRLGSLTAEISPLGLVIGSILLGRDVDSLHPAERLIPFIELGGESAFSVLPFSVLWNVLEQRQFEELARLVEGKVVMLFRSTVPRMSVPTPVDPNTPLAVVHAAILNALLTGAWLVPAPWSVCLTWALLLAVAGSWLVFRFGGRGWIGVGTVLTAYLILVQAAFVSWGLVLPVVMVTMAVVFAGAGAHVWTLTATHRRARSQLARAHAQLARFREELAGKEALVRELEVALQQVQSTARQSVERLEDVSAAEAQARARLHAAHGEVEKTRERIRQLEQTVQDIQSMVPVEDAPPPPRDSPAEMEQLRRECTAMGIVTNDPVLLKVFQDLKKAAPSQAPVLLLGETGTGKELFAHAVHRLSPRADGPFVPVNMAAIRGELFEGEFFGHVKGAFTGAVGRRGLLEAASGGTVFLDEIGELGLDLQAKLLRVLDDGTFYRIGESTPTWVDVRVVAATNRDLYAEVQAGRFREDLYYRLRSVVFRLPPLRERVPDDIAELARHLVQDLCARQGKQLLSLSHGAMAVLVNHLWPGNIRELRHVLAQAVAMCEGQVVTERDLRLDGESSERMPKWTPDSRAEFLRRREGQVWREDEAVLACLRRHRFDMQRTARALGWDRSTVTQRLKGIGFQALVEHNGDIHAAAAVLAGDPTLTAIVESRLREYYKNLVQSMRSHHEVHHAVAECRKRLRNLPDRHFAAAEILIRRHFAEHHPV